MDDWKPRVSRRARRTDSSVLIPSYLGSKAWPKVVAIVADLPQRTRGTADMVGVYGVSIHKMKQKRLIAPTSLLGVPLHLVRNGKWYNDNVWESTLLLSAANAEPEQIWPIRDRQKR